MNEKQEDLLRQVHAENAVIFSFIQAVIRSHPSPRLLLQRLDEAHNELMGPLLNSTTADQQQLDRIADEYAKLQKRINDFIEDLRAGRRSL
jgi:hypothetical protein